MVAEGEENRNTMSGRKLAPPIFSKDVNYKVWKNKLDLWKICSNVVCSIPPKEQGIIVLLQSIVDNKKAEKAVSMLSAHDLNRETGLSVLTEKLDNAFKDEIIEDTYSIYLKFTNLKKQPNMSMNDYIIEFENLSHEMKIHNMALPDTVLAFKILEGAMITDNQQQMALTLASFKSMKGALKRIFGEKSYMNSLNDDSHISSEPTIKEEDAFYTAQKKHKDKNKKLNPLTKQGKISQCAICDSKMHWAKNCQHKCQQIANIIETSEEEDTDNEYEVEDVNFVLMTTQNIEQTTPITPTNNSSKEQNTLENLTKQLAAIDINDHNSGKNNLHKIKKGQIIDFTVDNIPYKVEILSRAGKATGKFKNAFNIEYKEPISMCNEQGHVDFDKVNDIVINETNTEEIFIVDNSCFQKAKLNELNNWKTNNVYEEMPYNNQKLIHVKWVCTMKDVDNQQILKARLVVKGFEEPSKDEILKDSPTCSKETLRVLLSIIAQKKWKLNSIDIKAAFLQGENFDREIYISPPKEANTNKIWLLKKCTYGLVDASRQWYNTVKQVLLQLGFKMSKAEPSLFYYKNNNELEGIVTIHVDDFLNAGSEYFFQEIILKIRQKFTMGKECNTAFRYLGLDLKESNNGISLDQSHYINLLNTVNIKDENLCIHDTLQSVIGKLIWISSQTRPDTCFDVCHLASNLKNSTLDDIKHLNKVISHLKQSIVSLTFQNLGEVSNLKLVIYADAAHGNLVNGASQEGYLVFLVGENRKCILLNWQSKRIRRVV